ncbi:hypothetical protein SBA5_730020 [Candidatus Sulfotelmatomonas gaucii]|uniref:Uncharacterized protein n=1 Tax=Candidatus Sulfuritelmatomonas gaucii TaxID=2043161 RepID=A0A2N9M3G8_9BACT|nr:hypothetical protein SBA5_730020 [Candidatus Sulfotelmatomonas gaucii]
MLRSMRLDIGRGRRRRRLSISGRRRRCHSLHLDAAFVYDKVVNGGIAGFKVRLQAQALRQQHANRVPLFQPDLVIGELREPGIGRLVRAGLDVVERVRDPVWCADDRSIEAVCNLEKGLDRKIRGFKTAGERRAGDGYVEVGIRRWRGTNGGNVKGQRGRVVGLFHDGSLRVKVHTAREDEKGREQTDMPLNDTEQRAGHGAEHGHKTPCGNDTGEPPAQFPPSGSRIPALMGWGSLLVRIPLKSGAPPSPRRCFCG